MGYFDRWDKQLRDMDQAHKFCNSASKEILSNEESKELQDCMQSIATFDGDVERFHTSNDKSELKSELRELASSLEKAMTAFVILYQRKASYDEEWRSYARGQNEANAEGAKKFQFYDTVLRFAAGELSKHTVAMHQEDEYLHEKLGETPPHLARQDNPKNTEMFMQALNDFTDGENAGTVMDARNILQND